MEKMLVIRLAALIVLVMFCQLENSQGECEYPAIFNFGDSNSDTGGFYAAFPSESPPYGMTFFHKPVGRASDGRLVVDFIAQAFGLPFLSPYLQALGSDFRHGANYASDAGTVLKPNTSLFVTGISPFYLAVQFNQMKDFKVRVLDLLSKGKHFDYLPTTDVFSKALYFLDIGQNDFTSQLGWIGIEGVKKFLPDVASQIGETVKELYGEGERTIFVANLAPIGCFPSFLTELPHNNSDLDTYGCLISYNNAVLYYNNLLKEKLEEVRKVLPNASIVYVNSHAIKLEIYTNPRKHVASQDAVFEQNFLSLWGSGERWMLLAAQSMAVGTVMVRWVCKYSDPRFPHNSSTDLTKFNVSPCRPLCTKNQCTP